MDAGDGRVAHSVRDDNERRRQDQQIIEVLRQDDFQGPRYDRFVNELARYAIAALCAWMHSGVIFQLVATRGFGGLPHNASDREKLASNHELRQELAHMTVAQALRRFRERALVEGDWDYRGGASVKTYFMGTCLFEFPNVYRNSRASEERRRQGQRRTMDEPFQPHDTTDEAIGNLWVLEVLKGIDDPRSREAAAMRFDGYSLEEIREMLDAPSVRAIEGLLYRLRKKIQRDEGGEQHG